MVVKTFRFGHGRADRPVRSTVVAAKVVTIGGREGND